MVSFDDPTRSAGTITGTCTQYVAFALISLAPAVLRPTIPYESKYAAVGNLSRRLLHEYKNSR